MLTGSAPLYLYDERHLPESRATTSRRRKVLLYSSKVPDAAQGARANTESSSRRGGASRRPKTTQKGSALPPTPRLLLPSTRARAARRAQPRTTAAPRCLQWPLRVRDCVFDTALQRGGARRAKGHTHSDTCLSSVVRRLHQPLLLRVRRAVCSGLCHSLRALCPLRRARSGCSARALPASQW